MTTELLVLAGCGAVVLLIGGIGIEQRDTFTGGVLLAVALAVGAGWWLYGGEVAVVLDTQQATRATSVVTPVAGAPDRRTEDAQGQIDASGAPERDAELFWGYVYSKTCPGCAQWYPYIETVVAQYPDVEHLREALVAVSWKETNGEFYREDGQPKRGAAAEYCATQIVSNENPKYPDRPSPDWLMQPENCYSWTANRIVATYRQSQDWHYAFWQWNGLNDAGRRYADDVIQRFNGLVAVSDQIDVYVASSGKAVNGTTVTLETRQSANYSNRPAGTDIDTVVLHATVGGLQSSLNTLTKRGTGVSSHYLIAKDGTTYYLVDERLRAWHAGTSRMPAPDNRWNVNDFSIGIEIVNANNGRDPYPEAQLVALIQLLRSIVSRRQIPPENIVTHAQVSGPYTGKSDPRGMDVPALLTYVYGDSS